MERYTQIFRVRIDKEQREELDKGLAKWEKNNRWERPGRFWRHLLALGLKAYLATKD